MTQQTRLFSALLALMVLIALGLRLYRLGEYPQRFNQDEMVLGYDAWSIWQTGRDHHGVPLPITFRNFNDYVPPVATYITAPFVGLLGLRESTTRLPFALMGTIAVALTGLIGRRWFGAVGGLAAALFLTFDPWSFTYSRVAFPASSAPFFTAWGVYAFTRWIDALDAGRRGVGWLVLSALGFALLTGTYSILKVQAPLLVAACFIATAPTLWRHKGLAIAFGVAYLLFVSPLIVEQLSAWDRNQNRYDEISVFDDPNPLFEIALHYAQYHDPSRLLIEGYRGGVQEIPPGVGQIFWLEPALWLAAAIGFSQRFARWRGAGMLLLIWYLTFPVAAALTDYGPHDVRAINALPMPQLLAGAGAAYLWRVLPRWAAMAAGIVGAAGIGLMLALFWPYFFNPPLAQVEQPGREVYPNVGLRQALDTVSAQRGPCDVVWMDHLNQEYIYYLFLTQYPPERFQRVPVQKNTIGGFWLSIPWFDYVRFGSPENPTDALPPEGCEGQTPRTFFVTRREDVANDWRGVLTLRNDAGRLLWRVVAVP